MRILVVKRSGGNILLDASTDEALEMSAVSILKSRVQTGRYVERQPLDKEMIERASVSNDQISSLPEYFQDMIRSEREFIRGMIEWEAWESNWWTRLRRFLRGEGPRGIGWLLLKERSDRSECGPALELVEVTTNYKEEE